MVVAKLRTTAALLLTVSIVAAGATLLTHRSLKALQPAEPRAAEAMVQTSTACPDDLLPAGAMIRLEEHERELFRLNFSPDGKTLVAAGLSGPFALRDLATGREIHRSQRKGSGWALAVSPAGKTAATSDLGYGVCVWDLTTGKEIRTLRGHKHQVTALVYSLDGQTLISGGIDQTVRFWEVTTGKELRKWQVDYVDALALSPDGKTLAVTTAEGLIQLYEVATSKELRRMPGHKGQIRAVAFSPDGQSLASAGGSLDCTVRLWNVATGKEFLRLRAHEGNGNHRRGTAVREIKQGVNWVTFSPDGKVLASAGNDDKIVLWDVSTGKEIGRFEGHKGSVNCVAFSPDGKTLASASADKTVLLWDATVRIKDGRLPPVHLEPKEVEARWADLAAPEVLRASRAFWDLTAAPAQATPFLKERLRPVPHPDAKRIARLMADLDSDNFQVREKATQELIEFGEAANPALWQARSYPPSPEVGSRVEQILKKRGEAPVPPEKTRQLRAIMVLENINTPEARQVLDTLAKGAPGSALTREAKASLERLAKRSSPKP